jgi:outer membrane protein
MELAARAFLGMLFSCFRTEEIMCGVGITKNRRMGTARGFVEIFAQGTLRAKNGATKRRIMKKTAIVGITVLLVALLAAPPQGRAEAPAAQPPVPEATENNAGDGAAIRPLEKLTVERCVQVAFRNSANILAASHTVNATRSRVGEAWSGYYPQISLAGAYTTGFFRNTLSVGPTSTVLPFRQDSYSWSATLTQNIIDFGRTTAQVSIRQRDLDASQEDFRDATGLIVFNVKSAYYGLLRDEKSRDVLRETVALFEKQLEVARGFYEAGEKSKYDVTNAMVELSNAKLNLIRAENALRIARVTLNNAMGVPDAPEYTIEDTLSFQKYTITFEEARDKAFLNRPDIRSAAAKRGGAEESLSLARKGNFPTLSGNANYTRAGETYPPNEDTWNIGVTLTFPLFSGFLTTHQVTEAKENLGAIKANEEALRQNVLLTVQQAYFKLLETEERVGVAELTVTQAQENYELAQGRYEAGAGSSLEETNALVTLSNARTNFIAALADHKAAEAELQRAMGE